MPCLIWQAADVAKNSLFGFLPSQTPTGRTDLGGAQPRWGRLGNRAGRGRRILSPDPAPLRGLSQIWLFASSGGQQSLSFRDKDVLGPSSDGVVRPEPPPKGARG